MLRSNSRQPWRIMLWVALVSGCSAWAGAADSTSSSAVAEKLEEVIIEGRRVEERLSSAAVDAAKFGSQVQLISSAEIDTGGFTNFAELANGLIRGANVGYSPDEGEFTIRIDGGSDRDTLLLMDGVPTFDRGTPLEDIWGATSMTRG